MYLFNQKERPKKASVGPGGNLDARLKRAYKTCQKSHENDKFCGRLCSMAPGSRSAWRLVPEVPDPCENHGHPMPVRRLDYFLVAD